VYAAATATTVSTTTTDGWVHLTAYVIVETQLQVYVLGRDTQGVDNTDYFYFDDLSTKEVTDCAADGVQIVQAKGSATQNWTEIESGFDYNDSSYTFEVIIAGDSVVLFEGEIDRWQGPENEIEITVANIFSRWAQRTLAKQSASCRWKKFKGTECGYSGGQDWCDRTYTRCNALGNTASFGGFRWLPSIIDKEIWWGRQSKW
jgi:hypothetical protein